LAPCAPTKVGIYRTARRAPTTAPGIAVGANLGWHPGRRPRSASTGRRDVRRPRSASTGPRDVRRPGSASTGPR